jgi:hypothetical protein
VKILELLDSSPVVGSFEILDFKSWRSGFYIKLQVIFVDGTFLNVREYSDENDRHYSFHWQDSNNGLIIRWDNAGHHRQVKTFPHHKHRGGEVEESLEMSLADVLEFVNQTTQA